MKKHLLGFAIVVTLLWSPTFRANPSDIAPVIQPAPDSATGLASWYGEKFQGRTTASGEVYDMQRLTAAHRELPIGTWVEITNLRNGRFVTARINDRGPSIESRMLDVSKATAQALGFVGSGTATVRMRVVPKPSPRNLKPARPVLVSATKQPPAVLPLFHQ
jgi:rare lipoprotein A